MEAKGNNSKKSALATAGNAQPKLFRNCNVKSEETSGIATIDLSHEDDRAEYPNSKNLHHFHESVIKSSPAQVISHKKPTFSYTKGGRPQINSFDSATDGHRTPEDFLSDYDTAWMDDLPSPSALIASEGRAQSPVGSIKELTVTTDYDDDDSSELEAGMFGLDDSMKLREWTSSNAMDALPSDFEQAYGMGALEDDMGKDFLVTSVARTRGSRLSSIPPDSDGSFGMKNGEGALATSADSSEKRTLAETYNEKMKRRTIEVHLEKEESSSRNPTAKKQKTATDPGEKARLLSKEVEPQAAMVPASAADDIPSGLEDIDPEILAMFKDIVDFV